MFNKSFSYKLFAIGLGIIVMGYCAEGFGQPPKSRVPDRGEPRHKDVGPGPVAPRPKDVGPGPVAPRPEDVGPGPVAPRPETVAPHPVWPFGKPVDKLPFGYAKVRVGGAKYFYHAGVFYQKGPHGFLVVSPPVGAIIASIPVGFQVVVIGGATYYCYGGTYYQRVPSGYIVVEAPPGVAVSEELSASTQVSETATGHVSVTAPTLNVRSGPGANQPVIYQVYQGNILAIYGYTPGWFYVKLPSGKFGWVMKKFTVKVSSPASG